MVGKHIISTIPQFAHLEAHTNHEPQEILKKMVIDQWTIGRNRDPGNCHQLQCDDYFLYMAIKLGVGRKDARDVFRSKSHHMESRWLNFNMLFVIF